MALSGCVPRGGDVIDWVMRAEGVSFRHAVELLREDHLPLTAAARGQAAEGISTVPKLPAPVSAMPTTARCCWRW